MKIRSLRPGDLISYDMPELGPWIFVGALSPHPLHPSLWLVVWAHGGAEPHWSHDALSPEMSVPGTVNPNRDEARLEARLRWALHVGQRRGRRVEPGSALGL